jgi:hypothetical protein
MLENVTVTPNQIIATIPYFVDINPSQVCVVERSKTLILPILQVIQQLESIIITDTKGRSTIGHNKFLLDVRFNGDYVQNAINWLGKRYCLIVSDICYSYQWFIGGCWG